MPTGVYTRSKEHIAKHRNSLQLFSLKRRQKWHVVVCAMCGNDKHIPDKNYKRSKRHFCNVPCYANWLRFKQPIEEHHNYRGGISKLVTYHRHYNRLRKAKLKSAIGKYSIKQWEDMKLKYDYKCLMCGKQEPEIKLSVDHIVPLSLFGTNYIDNIQPLCISCNSKKRAKLIYINKKTMQKLNAKKVGVTIILNKDNELLSLIYKDEKTRKNIFYSCKEMGMDDLEVMFNYKDENISSSSGL